jgi:tetratricopeptide (TPR) repeat protein
VNKNAASQGEEEKVGLDVSREDRIGSSGLYRIRHLVGLRQGLGEMVGLDRVMEYEVATTSSKLFLVQPSIDANSGDLLMELNTSLQGTAKLVITGVDCGSIDAETGDVQRSLNTLTCYVTLKQSTIAAAATLRDRSLVSMSISGGGSPQYACVPSASTRSPSAGNRIGNGSGGSGGVAPFPGSASTSHDHSGNDPAAASDGFALSLAHFSQEFAAADRPASRSLSLSRDAAAGGVSGGSHQENDTSRRHNLDVQGVVARTAALAELCGGGSGGSPVSGAYANTGRRATSGGGAGQRPRMSVSSRDGSSGGISGAGAHYIFALTNPHDLRYRHVTEAVRLCRLQHLTRLQETEAQRRRETLPPAAPKPSVTNVPSSNAMSGRGKDNRRGEAVRYNSVVNHASWSDDEDDEGDKDTTREPSEASQSRSQESAGTIASGAAAAEKKRSCRKSVVEILELEEEFDQHNPVAIPTMMSHRSSQSARRVPSSQRLRSEPHASEASLNNLPSACPNAPDSGAARELRRPRMPSTLFCMNTMQSPVSYLRLTVWQDRLLLLFTEDDKELLRSDQRLRFKREARQELTEGSLAGMLGSTFAWSTNPGSSTSIGGRKLSMQSRRSSCVLNPRNFSLAGSAGGESAHDGGSGSNSSSPFSNLLNKNNGATNRPTSGGGHGAYNAAERPFSIIRRLILCLALEEERSSVQLYADVVQLCSHLCHSALLKTIALTRGTRNGLQQAAAAVLASGSPTPFPKAKAGCYATPVWEGNSTFSASDRESLRLLSDALELAMTVTLLIGAYGDAVEYALQRVHALCLLEGDTTAVVNAAQRDLVEAYLFHGDYATAVTIAEDVVMLTERLCLGDPGAYEVAEAEALCALACVSAGRRDRLTHYITRLELNVMPIGDGPNGTTATPLPLLQAQLRLVLSFAKMNLAGAAADVVALLREAVHLLRGDGDLQEIEQSFSTVFPSQTRLMANMESSNTSMPLSVRGRLASMASCSITAGPMMDNRSTAELNGSDGAVKMMAAQKRLRWNMLSFAGALLVENDETEEGIEVMESTVKELVLGQHRYVEHYHRSSIAALLWVGLLLLKSWAQPTSKEDFASMLKEVANRVVRLKGPLHPFAAAVNLQYANVAHHSLNSRHGLNLVSRSLSVLENAMSPQSHYLLMAHYVLGSMAESQQRWRPALEHLSAAYAIAQATHLCERDLLPLVTRFLGALLNCPTTAAVDVDMTTLRSQVEGHLTTVRHSAGPQSDALVEPLWNMAEVYYLLKQPADAVACLQQAVQLLDRRGVLLASADVLKPVDILRLEHQYQQQRDVNVGRGGGDADSKSIQQVVQERNAVVQASFDSVEQALWLANTLYMLGAMFEAQARTAEAQEKYAQCLAVFEAVQLGSDSLPAAHVMMAMAKLLYTEANCGDALRWAHKAELLLHLHYRKQWPLELESAEKLVAVVEQRLYEDEGTYVAQSDLSTQDGLPWLL